MSDDDTPGARAFALERFRARLAAGTADDDTRAAAAEDVLEVVTTIVVDVVLTLGGPTAFVRFHLYPDGELRRAEYVTSEHRYNGYDGYGTVTAELTDDAAVEAAELWAGGVDTLADIARSATH